MRHPFSRARSRSKTDRSPQITRSAPIDAITSRSCTLLAGSLDKAVTANVEAWRLKGLSNGGHDLTSARILWVRFALTLLQRVNASISLGQLRTVLLRPNLPCLGGIDLRWDVADVVGTLRERLAHDEVELLSALVDVLNDRSPLNELNRFAQWARQPGVPLEMPWSEPL